MQIFVILNPKIQFCIIIRKYKFVFFIRFEVDTKSWIATQVVGRPNFLGRPAGLPRNMGRPVKIFARFNRFMWIWKQQINFWITFNQKQCQPLYYFKKSKKFCKKDNGRPDFLGRPTGLTEFLDRLGTLIF